MEFREVVLKAAPGLPTIRRYCSDRTSKLSLMYDIYCERREMRNLPDEILKDIDRVQLNRECSRKINDIPENRPVKSLAPAYVNKRVTETEKSYVRGSPIRKMLRMPFLLFGFTTCTITLAEPVVMLPGELAPVDASSAKMVKPCRTCVPKLNHGITAAGLESSTHADKISWPCPKVSTVITS